MGYILSFLAGGYFSVLVMILAIWHLNDFPKRTLRNYMEVLFWPISLALEFWPRKTRYLP